MDDGEYRLSRQAGKGSLELLQMMACDRNDGKRIDRAWLFRGRGVSAASNPVKGTIAGNQGGRNSPVSSRQSPNDAVVFDCGEIWRAFEGHGLFGTVSRALSDFGVGIGLNVKQLTLS